MSKNFIQAEKSARLTLVGAGPGDPDLLTVKALKVLAHADVVLYDALVSDEVLKHIPRGVRKVSVGKRAGMHILSQEEINALIVRYAKRYGHVVRLKGGDPFVFGRGQEEIDYAEAHGIPTQVVPGISSALAVPQHVGIPVTARGVSESFWVITGTTQAGELSRDIALAAQSTATVVILMGMRKLKEIMNIFADAGKSKTPVAVIENGTLPEERWVQGSVTTILEQVRQESFSSPAVIVIGDVALFAREASGISFDELARRTA